MTHEVSKTIKEDIYRIVGHQLGVDPESLHDDSDLISDLNIAPIDLVDLVAALEEHFKIDIPVDEVKPLKTLQDLEILINELVNEI